MGFPANQCNEMQSDQRKEEDEFLNRMDPSDEQRQINHGQENGTPIQEHHGLSFDPPTYLFDY